MEEVEGSNPSRSTKPFKHFPAPHQPNAPVESVWSPRPWAARGIVVLIDAPLGSPCFSRGFVSVGTMGTVFSSISLVEKNDFSAYNRIILPTGPLWPCDPKTKV